MNRRDLIKGGLTGAAAITVISPSNLWKEQIAFVGNRDSFMHSGNKFTPQVFEHMIARCPFDEPKALFSSFDIWEDIVFQPEFAEEYVPVSSHQIVREGFLGQWRGVNMFTDGFRVADERTTTKGEVLLVRLSTAQKLSLRTDRDDFWRLIESEGAVYWRKT